MRRRFSAFSASVSGSLVLLAALAAAGCGAQAALGGGATPVAVAVATKSSGAAEVVVTGALAPAATVNVAPKIPGRVAAVLVEEGEPVKAGQVLLRLDTTDLEAQVRQAQAALARARDAVDQAKVNLDTARANFERMESLFHEGAVSAQMYEQAKAQFDLARTQFESARASGVAQAEAALQLARNQLASATVTAPVDGVVAARRIQAGEMASPSVPAITLVQIERVTLSGTVEEAVVNGVTGGQEAVVTVDALPGWTFKGRVEAVAPVASGAGGHFPVRIAIDNRDGLLKGGMSARATLRVVAPAAVLVPEAAVVRQGGQAFVYVVREGRAVRQVVSPGRVSGGQVEILSGIKAGDRVVAAGGASLADGQPVVEVGGS